jgi:CheY-like chemotaxis protein
MLERTVNKGISISSNLGGSTPCIIGDPTQIQNILLNLGINARDAQGDSGEIKFSTTVESVSVNEAKKHSYYVEAGEYLKVIVSDRGTGIDSSIIDKVFEPFFTTKELGKGTGMGLAAVYGTVKSHGGFINVDSKLGEGTSFIIYLPLSREVPQVEESIQQESKYSHSGKVLVIDDEESIRKISEKMLGRLGYSVITCSNGLEAIDIYNASGNSIDLVILDLIMPIMSGKLCYFELKKINKDIKVILSSGYSIDGEVQSLLNEGVSGFIQKPYVAKELSKAISKVLGA